MFEMRQGEYWTEIWEIEKQKKVADIEEDGSIYLYYEASEELLEFLTEIFGITGRLVPKGSKNFYRWQALE